MLKSLFVLLILSFSLWAQKASMDDRRKQILSIVDEELKEVNRLASQENYGRPDTILRLAELNMEKARLWRETENEQYLAIPPEERRNVSKANYFKRSGDYFEAANENALTVVKRFPKYKGIGEVYYILAFNYKELGDQAKAKKYFDLSAKSSPKNSKVGDKSKLALADYHFNAKDFAKAIPLYEESLSKTDDRWWTKDAFNLAWSYYRTRRYDKAINLMKEIHRKSGSDKYINMKNMVERDIAIFFVDASKMDEAVKFYESLGLNYTDQFVKIATSITSQGRFSEAETLLDKAAKLEKNRDRKITIYIAQLDLFDKYNKIEEHLETSQNLLKLHQEKSLNEDDFKRYSYHVNKKAAELQKSMASGLYKDVPKVKKTRSAQAIAYFELAAKLDPKRMAETTFFQGETAYSVGDFAKAIGLYIKAFDEGKLAKDKKIMTQSLEGMLSSLGQKDLNPKIAEKYFIPVYTRYLTFDNSSERAKSIYVKLFNTYFDANDIPAAEKTLESFAKDFPTDFKTQEGMLAKVMDYHRKKKDYTKVKAYVVDINEGKYKVSKKYAEALRTLMTKIQIEGVQTSLEKGQKDVALKGYHQIYESSESTPKARVNAAYNLAALYYELGDSNQSYTWAVTALKDMETADVVKFSDSYLSISAGLFLKQNFSQSADLSHRILGKLCKENSSNKVVAFKNAVFIALANNELDKALEIRSLGKSCSIPDLNISEVSFEILKELGNQKRWEQFEEIVVELEKNSKNHPFLIKPYEDLKKTYYAIGETQRVKEIEEKQQNFYSQGKLQKLEIPVEALDIIAAKMTYNLSDKRKQLNEIQLKFPEDTFNSAVKRKLQLLDQMASGVNEIQKTGSGKGIVGAYALVINAFENFAKELSEFRPEGKSPEYLASFQKAMAEVYNPIFANARKQRAEIKKLTYENKILTGSNMDVLQAPQDKFKRYYTVKEAVLMDRGGKR